VAARVGFVGFVGFGFGLAVFRRVARRVREERVARVAVLPRRRLAFAPRRMRPRVSRGRVPGDRRAEQQRDRERLERERRPDAEENAAGAEVSSGVGSDGWRAERRREKATTRESNDEGGVESGRRDVPAPHRSQPRHRERDREVRQRHVRRDTRRAVRRHGERARTSEGSTSLGVAIYTLSSSVEARKKCTSPRTI